MTKVTNKFGIEIKIGDKLTIISDRIGNKMLANVEKNDVIIVSGFSDNGKILYHHNTLGLPVDCNIYKKL
jgi:predicted transcriptional regulator